MWFGEWENVGDGNFSIWGSVRKKENVIVEGSLEGFLNYGKGYWRLRGVIVVYWRFSIWWVLSVIDLCKFVMISSVIFFMCRL